MNNTLYDRLKPGRPRCEEYEEIIRMRKDGHTYDAISYLLEVPRTTIASICQKEKLGGKIKNISMILAI